MWMTAVTFSLGTTCATEQSQGVRKTVVRGRDVEHATKEGRCLLLHLYMNQDQLGCGREQAVRYVQDQAVSSIAATCKDVTYVVTDTHQPHKEHTYKTHCAQSCCVWASVLPPGIAVSHSFVIALSLSRSVSPRVVQDHHLRLELVARVRQTGRLRQQAITQQVRRTAAEGGGGGVMACCCLFRKDGTHRHKPAAKYQRQRQDVG